MTLNNPSATAQCPTCANPYAGNFCPQCGEERLTHHDLSLGHFLGHALHEFIHLDSKVFVTLRNLVTRPGSLTAEYLAGRRQPYVRPLRLYLVIFAVFFFAASAFKSVAIFDSSRITQSDKSGKVTQLIGNYAARHNEPVEVMQEHLTERWKKFVSLGQVLDPLLLAAFLCVIYWGSRRYYVEHLIFALHALAFNFLWTAALLPVYYFAHIDPAQKWNLIFLISWAVKFSWMFVAVRRVYGQTDAVSLIRTVLVFMAEQLAIILMIGGALVLASVVTIQRG